MNKTVINFMLILCLVPFLIQCVATKKEIQSTNVKVYRIDNKVDTIDNEIEQLKTRTVKDVQSRQALVTDRIDEQQSEIGKIHSKLEENAHYNRVFREENKELETTLLSRLESLDSNMTDRLEQLNQKIVQLNEKLVVAEKQIVDTQQGIKHINQQRAKEAAEKARKAAEAARKAAKAAENAKAKSKSIRQDGSVHISADKHKVPVKGGSKTASLTKTHASSPAKDLYTEGLTLFKAKKLDQAYDTFAEYLHKYANGKMAPNARFWMGECLYKKSEYELAILDYQKVIIDFPNHAKAPAALLKQGMAFETLKDSDTAKIVYQKILDDYSKSDQAATAKKRLAALK